MDWETRKVNPPVPASSWTGRDGSGPLYRMRRTSRAASPKVFPYRGSDRNPVLAGETKPKAALDDIYQAWEQITERYGRDNQKKLYAESYASS